METVKIGQKFSGVWNFDYIYVLVMEVKINATQLNTLASHDFVKVWSI
jgi:hypothetical protein